MCVSNSTQQHQHTNCKQIPIAHKNSHRCGINYWDQRSNKLSPTHPLLFFFIPFYFCFAFIHPSTTPSRTYIFLAPERLLSLPHSSLPHTLQIRNYMYIAHKRPEEKQRNNNFSFLLHPALIRYGHTTPQSRPDRTSM